MSDVLSQTKDEKRERMLCLIRDTLVERAAQARTSFELNPFLYCQGPEGREQLKRVVAQEAAADVFTHLVAEWQKSDRRQDWLRAIVHQAMATFIEAFK